MILDLVDINNRFFQFVILICSFILLICETFRDYFLSNFNSNVFARGQQVPNRYNVFAKPIVEGLLKTAEKFSQELKNHTVTRRCEMKYKEVLCRLVDACSPNGFYYLHYITLSECEQMISW